MSNLVKHIGASIRFIRKQKGYTQEYLAEKANLHYSYIGGIERGERNISLETLEKIILALEMEPFQIFETSNSYMLKYADSEKLVIIQQINELLMALDRKELQSVQQILQMIVSDFISKDH